MDVQRNSNNGSSESSPQRRNRVITHKRRKIRYLRLSVTLMVLALVVIGIPYTIYQLSHWNEQQNFTETPVIVVEELVPEAETVINQENTSINKVVYLTFDDGPSKYTEYILEILKQHNAKATFFLIGSRLNRFKSEVEKIVKEGSYPGLHSMSHDYDLLYKSGDSANFIEEFINEQAKLREIIGFSPILIRAPYGSKPQIDETFRGDIAAAGFRMWDWTLDSQDWNLPEQPDKIVELVSNHLHRDIEVILLHERKQTVEALPHILKILEERGYRYEVYDPNNHIIVNFSDDPRL